MTDFRGAIGMDPALATKISRMIGEYGATVVLVGDVAVVTVVAGGVVMAAIVPAGETALAPVGYVVLQQGGGTGVVVLGGGTLSAEGGALALGRIAQAAWNSQILRNAIALEIGIEATATWLGPENDLPRPTPGGLIGFGAQQLGTPGELLEWLEQLPGDSKDE